MCGCPRESLYHCKCGIAAKERGFILGLLAQHDLSSSAGREAAREDVIAQMMAKNASEEDGSGSHVLMVAPDKGFNRLAWAVPYIAFAGAFALIIVMGRRWVRTGKGALASADLSELEEDENFRDILDDELRETD